MLEGSAVETEAGGPIEPKATAEALLNGGDCCIELGLYECVLCIAAGGKKVPGEYVDSAPGADPAFAAVAGTNGPDGDIAEVADFGEG